MEKGKGLALAITIKDGKTESNLRVKDIGKFEVIGLLVFQIMSVIGDIKKGNA